jgi:hypothetical protein
MMGTMGMGWDQWKQSQMGITARGAHQFSTELRWKALQ